MKAGVDGTLINFTLAVGAIITVIADTHVAVDAIHARRGVHTGIKRAFVKVLLTVLTDVARQAGTIVARWVVLTHALVLAGSTQTIVDWFLAVGASEAISTHTGIV